MRRALWRVAVGLAVVLGLGLSGLVCARVEARGRYATAFSTYGAGPEGTRGLALLAEELGARPVRWAEDLGRLPDGGLLVALGSCDQLVRRPLTRPERDNLVAWIEGGGVLVVAGVPEYLEDQRLGVTLSGDAARCRPTAGLIGVLARGEARERDAGVEREDDLERAFEEDPTGTVEDLLQEDGLPPPRYAAGAGTWADAPSVGLRRPLDIRVDERRTRETLLRVDGDGPPAAVRVDVGEGAVIALASASAFQNRDLLRERGGVLFARILRAHAPEGPVMFDEFHLGVGERRSLVRYLRQVGAMPALLQVLLVIALLVWRFGRRFGALTREAPAAPAGTASYVEGVGAIYEKAKDAAGVGEVLVRRAIERVATHHHLSTRDPARLAQTLGERGERDAADAVRALAQADAGSGLAALAREIDVLVARATGQPARTGPA